MHDYSIDRHPKQKVLFVLAFLAIAGAPYLNGLMKEIVTAVGVRAGWTSPPVTAVPVFVLFTVIYVLFDRYLWRWRWLRRFLLVPDLNGKWRCTGRTVKKDGEAKTFEWTGDVAITQSWSKILVYLRTSQSESKSISASLFHEHGVGYRLLYQYDNNPKASELDLGKHSGLTEVLFAESTDRGEGHYFTDQHRGTVGELRLERINHNGHPA